MNRADLVAAYGSPLYVYDLAQLDRAAADLTKSLPQPSTTLYSLKANPHPGIVRQLRATGCEVEVSSVGELRSALTAGATGADVLYTGPGKTYAELEQAISAGIIRFSVESFGDMDRIGLAAERLGTDVAVILRVNAANALSGGGLRMTGKASQFGIDAHDLVTNWSLDRVSPRVEVIGLHFFPITNSQDEKRLIEEFGNSVEVAASLARLCGIKLKLLDIGGGFAAPYATDGARTSYPALGQAVEKHLDTFIPRWRQDCQVAFESGRRLVAECGTLLTTVVDVKVSRDQTFVVLDGGINVLGGMSGLGRLLPMNARPTDRALGVDMAGPPTRVTLVGPTCTPTDVLGRGVRLATVQAGDVLAIPNVGAYGLSASLMGFLSRPLPAEVLVQHGEVVEHSRIELQRRPLLDREPRQHHVPAPGAA